MSSQFCAGGAADLTPGVTLICFEFRREGDEETRFCQNGLWRGGPMATCGARTKQQGYPSHWRALACGQRRGRRSLFHGICRRIARSRIPGWDPYYIGTPLSKRDARPISEYGSGTCIVERGYLSQRRFSNCILREGRYTNDPHRFYFRARPSWLQIRYEFSTTWRKCDRPNAFCR